METKEKLDGIVVEFVKKVGPSGKTFGSVTSTEITAQLSTQGLEIERRQLLIETPIKSVGSFDVRAHLFEGVDSNFQVKVVMDPAQAEEMKAKRAAAKKKAEKKEEKAATEDQGEEKTHEDSLDDEVNKIIRS